MFFLPTQVPARDSHGEAHVGGAEGGRIVGAVARHLGSQVQGETTQYYRGFLQNRGEFLNNTEAKYCIIGDYVQYYRGPISFLVTLLLLIHFISRMFIGTSQWKLTLRSEWFIPWAIHFS